MAVDPKIYALTEWQFAIKPETTVGTKNVTTMQLVNVDVPITISDNPSIANEIRTKDGRTKKSVDHFATEEGQVKSITISGIADKTNLLILAENCFGIAEASNIIDLPYNFTGSAFKFGKTSVTDNLHTLTCALVSAIGSNTRIYPGCIVDELSWVEDVETDGGRRHFTAVFLTRSNPSNNQATPSNMSAYPSTYYSIWDYTEKYIGQSELFANQEDRDFSSPSNWTNTDIATYDETDDLSLTANATGQYAQISMAWIGNPLVSGNKYRLSNDYTETVAGFEFKLVAGTAQTLGDAVAGTAQTIIFTADEDYTGGEYLGIFSKTNSNAQGHFDNFSLIKINDVIMSKLEISIKSNVKFYGLGTDGVCEVMDRGLPGFDVSAVISVKYDSETMSESLKYPAGTAIVFYVGDNEILTSALMGIRSDYSYLTADLNLGNVDEGAFIDIPLEFKAGTSGSQLQIAL